MNVSHFERCSNTIDYVFFWIRAQFKHKHTHIHIHISFWLKSRQSIIENNSLPSKISYGINNNSYDATDDFDDFDDVDDNNKRRNFDKNSWKYNFELISNKIDALVGPCVRTSIYDTHIIDIENYAAGIYLANTNFPWSQ